MEAPLKRLNPAEFVMMDLLASEAPFRIDLAYARADNLLFGERIYRDNARLWLHPALAEIVARAAGLCYRAHGAVFVLYDGLRTTDAQALMLQTKRVRYNPHWLEEPRLLSPPGAGGHPRGMAVDIGLAQEDGTLLDMGTAFDFLAQDARPHANPAHRDYPALSEEIRKNRAILTDAMLEAAEFTGHEILPLPQEWWDFRFPASVYEQYAPLADEDLPENMRMVG